MTYRINEFNFALPDTELQDASINIIKFTALGTSLIISRSILADDETLHSNFDTQLKRLEQQVQALRYQPAQTILVGPAQDIEAVEMRSQFSNGDEQVFQFQLALVIPGTRKIFALSYVKAAVLDDAEAMHWATLKNSLQLDHVL